MYDSPYFNSVAGQGVEDVAAYTLINDDQNSNILAIFKTNPDKAFTPYMIEEELIKIKKNYLITSIRRALTTLTEEGSLVKTEATVMCRHGRTSHLWELNPILKTQQIKLLY